MPTQGAASLQRIDESFALRFLEELYAAFNVHDADAIAALCSENVVWEDPAAPLPLHGSEAVRRFHRDVMFRSLPDVRITVLDGPYLSLDCTGLAVRLRIEGTMEGPMSGFAPTGGPLHFETAEFSHFEGSLLAHHVVVLDRLTMATQIGAVPKAGGFSDRVGKWFQHLAAWRARSPRR